MTKLGPVDRIEITSREQWLGLRRQDVTASDIPSICGVGYRTALAVWAEKIGRVPPRSDTAVMRKGRWFEPAIFEAMAELYPEIEVRRAKIYLRSALHRLGCTPDAVAVENEKPGILVVQGKVVSRPVFQKEWLIYPDQPDSSPAVVPLPFQLQTLTETMLAEGAYGGEVRACVAALVHDTFTADLYLIPVERNETVESHILNCNKAFWRDVDAGRRPEVDLKKDGETLAELFPDDNGIEIDLTGDNSLPALFDERQALGETVKQAEARRDEIKTAFQAAMGEAAYATLADRRRVSLKTTMRAPAMVKGSTYRVLRIAAKKKGR